jgi:Skp family chaperone for outer membrane proteins
MLTFKKSSFPLRGAALSFLLAFGVCAATTIAPQAAHAQATGIGVVDEDKLADGYKKYKDAVDAIDKRAQSLDSQIPARELLNDEQGKSFDTLIALPNPTADQSTKLKALVDAGMENRATYMGLVGKANRTPEETTKMKAMQDQMTKNGPGLRTLSDSLLAAIRQQQDDTDKQYTERANSVVAQVANDKKCTVVVRKKALVWSSETVDITEEVLKRLNAG